MSIYINEGTIEMTTLPSVCSFAAAGGKMEGEGPLGSCYDYISEDSTFGESTWEKAESRLQQHAMELALAKGGISEGDVSFIFAGDLLNQCTGSAYSIRATNIPFIGLYGACSTMAESLALASVFADNNVGNYIAALTSSHFCSAERQFRFPETYGGQRTPTAQWTATASGCAIVGQHSQPPYIRAVTFGRISDLGIKDANNMGAAMAPVDVIITPYKKVVVMMRYRKKEIGCEIRYSALDLRALEYIKELSEDNGGEEGQRTDGHEKIHNGTDGYETEKRDTFQSADYKQRLRK